MESKWIREVKRLLKGQYYENSRDDIRTRQNILISWRTSRRDSALRIGRHEAQKISYFCKRSARLSQISIFSITVKA